MQNENKKQKMIYKTKYRPMNKAKPTQTIFSILRKYKSKISFLLAFLFFSGFATPHQLFALTSGPSTPEASMPSKITSQGLVDPFTGNLNYSIPLIEVGDYALSMSYNADISMDQEASWVGLGWSLNPGSISRSVRGLPDDFKGTDKIHKEFNTKPSVKAGLNAGVNLELFGIEALGEFGGANLGSSLGLFYDNYQGVGLDYSISPSISAGSKSKGELTASMGINGGSHKNGISLQPSLSYSQSEKGLENASISSTVNSLSGLQSINLNVSKKNSSNDYNASFNSFTDQSYKPTIKLPKISTHGTFSLGTGGEIFGVFAGGSLTGYYTQQQLADNSKKLSAYGYMYTEEAQLKPDALLDFKREKDDAYTASKTNLPVPNYTYDVFNISGHGISGAFRAHRGDVGVVYDHKVTNLGGSKAVPAVGGFGLSAEIGGGNLVKIGVDLETSNSENKAGIWKNNSPLVNNLSALPKGEMNDEDYESFYFKMNDEMQVRNNKQFYNTMLQESPAAVKLAREPVGKAYNVLHGDDGSKSVDDKLFKKSREIRNSGIAFLTADKASRVALNSKIKNYPLNSTPMDVSTVSDIDRLQNGRKKHHLSEITVLKSDKRYVYGVPAYNNFKKEVVFNVDDLQADCQNGFITYDPDVDNTTNNKSGQSHYFSSTKTPAYAYSFLLSSVLSEEYVDVTGNGPTPDDLGDYTRFNYTRVHDDYRWRSPYRKNKANYQENQYSLDNDNMANYAYGSKEIWYINSIESRNYVAKFIVTDREDGLGVIDENGGRDQSQKLKKLSRIELYTRAELNKNGNNATPLKTIHFEYKYELAKGIPNHMNPGSGKLTLKSVYFTYGNSKKGKFSPYSFEYFQGSSNPDYTLKSNDRFGFYKPNSCNSNQMTNAEYPYVDHNKSDRDQYIKAWKLEKVKLPSGGTIKIEYESDDYAYVQDKRAMQMAGVAGFSDSQSPTNLNGKNKLYEGSGSNYKVNDYMFFELQKPLSSEEQLEEYFPDENLLYFKIKVDLVGKGDNTPDDPYEYISGFAEYEDFGFYENSKNGNQYSIAWIKLKKVKIGDYKLLPQYLQKKANPLARRAWTYSKTHIPKHAFNRTDDTDAMGSQLINALGSLTDMITMVISLNSKLIMREFARNVDLDRSIVRLNNPTGYKPGGGHRVKKVLLSDEWSKMAGSGQSGVYGKVYDYTTVRNGQRISSGVAQWEPNIGKDENPFYQPVFYEHNGDRKFMTEPFGESFFPGPKIGYSRIEIRDLPHNSASPAPEGYQVKTFYTAKDFPIQTQRTNLQDEQDKPGILATLNPFMVDYVEKRTVSQGYKVELNDMHGKPKGDYTYRYGSETPLNGKEYKYLTNEQGELINEVKVLRQDRTVENETVGVDVDFVVDSRQQISKTKMMAMNINTDGFMASIIPVLIPIGLPAFKKEYVRFRSVVTSKVIRKKGIMESITVYKNGAKLHTKNLVYDAVTGNAVVSKKQNKFGRYVYQTKIPAHLEYKNMGPSYQNILASFDKVAVKNGEIQINTVNQHLVKGDELYWTNSDDISDYGKAWVLSSDNQKSVVIDRAGALIPDGKYNFTVIRSGYNNKSSTTIGAINSLQNPVQNNKLTVNSGIDVLSAKAIEYSENWQTYNGFQTEHIPSSCDCQMVNMGKGSVLNALIHTIFLKDDGETVRNQLSIGALENKVGRQSDSITVHKTIAGDRLIAGFKWNGTGAVQCEFTFENIDGNHFYQGGMFSNYQPLDNDPYRCGDVYAFSADYTYQYKDTITKNYQTHLEQEVVTKSKTVKVVVENKCFKTGTCEENDLESYFTCDLKPGEIVNPFVNGIQGIWRPFRSYKYLTDRSKGSLQTSGVYNRFKPFNWNGNNADEWIWTNKTTRIDPFGNELETKNVYGEYEAALYGYSYTKMKMRAANAGYHQIGYDGFEDYRYYESVSTYGDCDPPEHLRFSVNKGMKLNPGPWSGRQNAAFISDKASHTGSYSARATSLVPLYLKRDVNLTATKFNQQGQKEYVLQPDDYAGIFNPNKGKYHISAWVKDKLGDMNYETYHYKFPKIDIYIDGSKIKTLRASGPVIDGWQQITGDFNIPGSAGKLQIKLATDFGVAFFDDFRIHPFQADAESFVYDPVTLRLKAKLNGNNYASFYQYNGQGELTGVKKETEKGIISTQVIRRANFKNNK